jgi:hypothetical protein
LNTASAVPWLESRDNLSKLVEENGNVVKKMASQIDRLIIESDYITPNQT